MVLKTGHTFYGREGFRPYNPDNKQDTKELVKSYNNNIRIIPKAIDKGSQRGEVIHHQDQLIRPVSFKTKKTINTTPVKDKPDFELFI